MYYYGSVVSSFSKSKRDCLLIPKDLNNLGPGSNYTNNDLKILHVKSPSYSIRNKHKNIIKEITPGPGHYSNKSSCLNINNISTFYKNAKCFNPCNMSTHNISNTNISNNPGPGSYDNLQTSNRSKTPSYSFGKENRNSMSVLSTSPGPGSYHLEAKINIKNRNNSFNKAVRKELFNNDNSLIGPGKYNNLKKRNISVYSFSKSKRLNETDSLTPGPCSYEPRINNIKSLSSSYTISKSKRESLMFQKVSSESNGPGKYNCNYNSTAYPSSLYSFPKEIRKNDISLSPGPGQYTINYEINKYKSPICKISKSERNNLIFKLNENPDPGKYINIVNVKSNLSTYSFSKEKRLKETYNTNPGPGEYNLPNSIRNFNK